MRDFALAALPWIACGMAIAVVMTYYNDKKNKMNKKNNKLDE